MKLKPLIRIIKREQRKDADRDAEAAAQNKATTEDSVRRITTTVSAWVYEFQRQRPVASKRAFENLFTEQILQSGGIL